MSDPSQAASLSHEPDASAIDANPILVLNSGSSSLKAGLFIPDASANFAGERAILTAQASGIGQGGGKLSIHDASGKELHSDNHHELASQEEALTTIAAALNENGGLTPTAVGHRVVHGGPQLRQHTLLTLAIFQKLEQSIHFAPLHLPASLRLIKQTAKLFPDLPQIVCFDTAFHQTMPAVATRLPVPQEFAAAGVKRYGFHGLSYESLIGQLRAEPARLPDRIVLAHLGSGASLCAAYRGASVDTTMGMTPTGGIPMATRTGDLDPGVLFFMAREARLSVDALEQLVNHKAGLAAISSGTGDMQQLEKAMQNQISSRNPATSQPQRAQADHAALAFAIFATAIAKSIAALTVSLSGLDLLVFAGGIGEHSAPLRAAVLEKLAPFGIRIDAAANDHHAPWIQAPSSKVPIRILSAEEDLVIAAHTRRLLATV